MAALKLDFLIIPTYNSLTMGIADNSVYAENPPIVTTPSLLIKIPGEDPVTVPFIVDDFLVLDSVKLGFTTAGTFVTLPDGIYTIAYSVVSINNTVIEKTFMRVELIQEKFDKAFLKLELMECDGAIKKQSKIDLDTIYYFIQGAIAAANNCMQCEAEKLYKKADSMLDKFTNNNCNS
jgi:hypothetical protein